MTAFEGREMCPSKKPIHLLSSQPIFVILRPECGRGYLNKYNDWHIADHTHQGQMTNDTH